MSSGNYIALTNKFEKTRLPLNLSGVDSAYLNFCRVIKKQPKKYPTQLPKQLHTLLGCRVFNALYNFLAVPSNETRLKLSCYGFIGQT